MIVDSSQTAAQTAAAAAANPLTNTAEERSALSGDFETFLSLLTAQMRNQDPLKPMESTEFVSQLANFSAVEQQVKTNDALEAIYTALSSDANLGNLATWIGREAQVAGAVGFNGDPITISTTPVPDADAAVLEVMNASGQVVRRIPFPPDANEVLWDGNLADLSFAPRGDYAFRASYSAESNPIGSLPGRVFVPITEVRIENGSAVLVDENGTAIPLSSVTGVRQPPSDL